MDKGFFAGSDHIGPIALASLNQVHRFKGKDGFPDGGPGDLERFG